MNIDLLHLIQWYIAIEPRRLDMNILATRNPQRWTPEERPPCGTAGCICGWAAILTKFNLIDPIDIDIETQNELLNIYILGDTAGMKDALGWDDGRHALWLDPLQAERLFREPSEVTRSRRMNEDMMGWPLQFAQRYMDATTAYQRAWVTIERIDHFIATGGDE